MKRDPDVTRSKLLAAARDEFAEHGIAGGRVDRIADSAGVNKQRIYGHFGNKEALFRAVIEDALDERAAGLGPPTGDLGEYVGRVYDFHRENPQLLRLFLWEALHHGADADDDPRAEGYDARSGALAGELGIDEGRARTLYLTLIGMGAWPLAVPQLTELVRGRAPDDLRGELVELARRMTSDL